MGSQIDSIVREQSFIHEHEVWCVEAKECQGGLTIMLTRAHRIVGQRVRNRRGNSTLSAIPAGSLPFERHVIPLGSQSAEPSVSETAQWPYTHTTWPQSGNGSAKNVHETRAIHQEPSISSCHSKQSRPGNKGVLLLSPASRNSFPVLPLLA